MTKILIVEDDASIREHLKEFLEKEGYQTQTAKSTASAMSLLSCCSFDLILLDVMLGDGSGYSLCSAIQSAWDTPVIFLTAMGDEYSVVTGFQLGADDYIVKPFRPRELLSRIQNVLRRRGHGEERLEYQSLTIFPQTAKVTKNGQEVLLSALEYRLLLLFFQNKGTVLSRGQLLSRLWDVAGDYVNDNTLTVYIKRLRDKIEDDPGNPTIIKTIRGMGYLLGEL